MKTMNRAGLTLSVLAVLLLGGCGTMQSPQYGSALAATPSQHVDSGQIRRGYGTVQSVELVRAEAVSGGGGIGVGAVAGAVVGGLVGNQIGSGSGRTAATIVGAAGGAYVGHQIENRQQQQSYQPDQQRVTMRMDDGVYQSVMQGTEVDLRVGDRVWVGDGGVRRI